MTKLAGYRLSTAIFALLFAFMVVKDLTRPEPEVKPERRGSSGRPPSSPGPETTTDGRSDVPVSGPNEDTPSRSSPKPATPAESATPAEDAYSLTVRLLVDRKGRIYRSDWKRVLELLEPRREEVVPLLEDWLRRRAELEKQRIHIENVPVAYAKLAGAKAIPLLRQWIDSRSGSWTYAVRALCHVDDPSAVDLLRAYQQQYPPRNWLVGSRELMNGSPAFRASCLRWATEPPAGLEWIAPELRRELFLRGTPAEREMVWPLLDAGQRVKDFYAGRARLWGEPWPARYRETVTRGLGDPDPFVRYYAADRIIRDREQVDPALLARAEKTLEQDLSTAGGGADTPKPAELEGSLRLLRTWREGLERERRKRELLEPR